MANDFSILPLRVELRGISTRLLLPIVRQRSAINLSTSEAFGAVLRAEANSADAIQPSDVVSYAALDTLADHESLARKRVGERHPRRDNGREATLHIRRLERFLRQIGYKPVSSGNGDQLWKNVNGDGVSLPRNRGDLTRAMQSKLLKQISQQLGFQVRIVSGHPRIVVAEPKRFSLKSR